MPAIKRKIWLNYEGQNYEFYRVANSDKQAVLFATRELERMLGKVNGSLRNYFLYKPNSWEVFIL